VRYRFAVVAGAAGVVRETGTPDVAGGVVLIEPFTVPAGDDEAFLAAWEQLREARAHQRGYLGSRLYGQPRFVDFTRWSSPLMYARALKLPSVQEATAAMPFRSDPALYLPAG
jgi:heme-degrading monooxygenase HmoA